MEAHKRTKMQIQSTAGAVPVRNEKGDVAMEKVKVSRYVTGKRPDYAPDTSSEEDSDAEVELQRKIRKEGDEDGEKGDGVVDRRLQRLLQREAIESDEEDRVARHRRQVVEPEVLAEGSDDDEGPARHMDDEDSSEGEEMDEEEVQRRRTLLRQRALNRSKDRDVMDVEEEKSDKESDDESSEYEEYTDSEEETGPRLKPVFVRRKDRVTIQEKEKIEQREKELEIQAKVMAEERRRRTIKVIDDEKKREQQQERSVLDACDAIDSDEDIDDETEYEGWKLRELKRVKRDRDERETIEKEKMELDRVRGMTEEERRQEFRSNPKQVTNKAPKGKYKFLQKYYHRGAYFLDQEENMLKRDFSGATLEDHFDKTILPKVMQVKNFGRSGRTKYTHLVDQDTTQFDSPWLNDTAQNLKFHSAIGGGMKQTFSRPSNQKRK